MNYHQSFEALRRNIFLFDYKRTKKTTLLNSKTGLPDPTSTLTLGKDNSKGSV